MSAFATRFRALTAALLPPREPSRPRAGIFRLPWGISRLPWVPRGISRLPRAWAWAVTLIGAVLFIVASGQWAARHETLAQADAIRRATEVHVLGLRGVADRYNYLPFTVAQHPDILSLLTGPGVPGRIQSANHYLEGVNRRAGSDALYVMDADGTTLAASNWNRPRSFVGESYGNRPYFIDARQGRSGRFYGIGKTTGEPGLFISAPVRQDGAVIGVVAVKVSMQQILEAWANVRDPVLLSDERGIVFLGSEPSWMYRATRELDRQEIEQVQRDEQYGSQWQFRLLPWRVDRTQDVAGYLVRSELNGRDRRFLAIDETLPDLGWTLTVMADHAAVSSARYQACILSALASSLLLMGGLHWRLRERRFREQREARRELEVRVRERTQELQQAHAFRKAMEDSLLVGMRARDLAGRIIYVNLAMCEMTGYGADELMGRLPPYPYWHPDDLEKHWRDNDAALSGQAALTGFESRIRHRDGHDVFTMVYTAPLIDAAGRHSGWMSSVVDITEQKRAEERQRQQDEQLQRIGRVVTVGEMASTLAHELNQPLMALVNFASAAKAFAEQGRHGLLIGSLADITAQAERAAEIVRHVRGFLRQRTEGLESCAVNDIVTHALALLRPEIRSMHVRAVTRLANGLPAVKGDRVLLEQVLLNLLLNAIQAMRSQPSGQRVVEITTLRAGDGVDIRVADRGTGIAPEVAARLFEPFFTTKQHGLGLGLNICRTIVESHSGRLSFANRPDGGAAFTVHIPGAA
jgi:two-component system, LuxR family, sensor histidine kinase DctS